MEYSRKPLSLSWPRAFLTVAFWFPGGGRTVATVHADDRISFVTEGLRVGKLKPVIDKTFPLDEIAEARRYMEVNGQVGKIVVVVE